MRDNLTGLAEMEIALLGHVSDDAPETDNERITITGASWTAITAVGRNATIWTYSSVPLYITSSVMGSPDITTSYIMQRREASMPLSLNADDPNEIFYARCVDPNDTSYIIRDYI